MIQGPPRLPLWEVFQRGLLSCLRAVFRRDPHRKPSPLLMVSLSGWCLQSGRSGSKLCSLTPDHTLDPDCHLARAYPGLWHLEQGKPGGAVQQLTEIEKRGGRDGDARPLLSDTIAKGAARDGAAIPIAACDCQNTFT